MNGFPARSNLSDRTRARSACPGPNPRTTMPATLSLHSFFSNHGVLPRDVLLPVFGRAVPGQTVKVALAGRTLSARADARGHWRVVFDPLEAGGPHTLAVSLGMRQLIRRDLWIGEVWVLVGGSCGVAGTLPEAIAATSLPTRPVGGRVRMFNVPDRPAAERCFDVDGAWFEPTRERSGEISLAGWHMASVLEDALDCPVGVVRVAASGPAGLEEFWSEGVVFQGMIAPLTGVPVRGIALWPEAAAETQGVPVSGSPLDALVEGWRQAWSDAALPFVVVARDGAGTSSGKWQMLFGAGLASMGVSSERLGLIVGERETAAPQADRERVEENRIVGEHLALCALAVAYGRRIPGVGPKMPPAAPGAELDRELEGSGDDAAESRPRVVNSPAGGADPHAGRRLSS